jgi:hypothetical protein
MASSASSPTAPDTNQQPFFTTSMAVIWGIALANLVFHVYFNNRYGYFRDEFDYMSCGDHLAWGYVDQAPLIPFLIHICRALLGDSLRAIRFIPALASSLLVVQTALIARGFGGRRFALLLSAVTILIAPQYLSNGSLLTTNCLEPILWMGCAYFAILAIKRNQPRYWLWFGVVAGFGLEEKYTIALLCCGIVVGLLLTRQRRAFANKWIWLGGAAAFLIFLPNLLWNSRYHWPFLQLMHNIRAEHRDVILGPGEYFLEQMFLVHPLTAPIWLAGLGTFFFSARLKPYRFLGWAYVICYAVLFMLHGKNYYLAPVYPMLLAAGAVVIEAAVSARRKVWFLGGRSFSSDMNEAKVNRALAPEAPVFEPRFILPKSAILIVLLAGGACLLPITVPVLSPDHFIAYMKRLPFKLPVMEYAHERAVLPQWYADQFGWNEIVEETAVAWNEVPPSDRADCAIFAQDYGAAGAIDFLGRRDGLPPAISGNQTWFLWGPRGYSGNCLIVLDDRQARLEQLFDSVRYVGESRDNPYALEKRLPVWICRTAKFGTLAQLWPELKRWR